MKITDDNGVRKMRDLGPLQDLLIKACPPDKDGIRSVRILARSLDMSDYGVYRWIENGRVPQARVKEIVDNSDGAVTLEEFLPFVFT